MRALCLEVEREKVNRKEATGTDALHLDVAYQRLKHLSCVARSPGSIPVAMATAAASVIGLRSSLPRVTPKAGASFSFATASSSRCLKESRSIGYCALASSFNAGHSALVLKKQARQISTAGVVVRAVASTIDVVQELRGAREEIKRILAEKYCHPILVRLGWHDAGTFDKNVKEWPNQGGANGSLRFSVELAHGANAGLINALQLIEPVKQKYPNVSYADLFQLASATAIEEAGGKEIPMRYGRVDTSGPEECAKEGNLPDAGPPSPAQHLRKVFHRMGLTDQELVVLSGAHTLGRSRPDRSGWGKSETKYTKDGPGSPGGQSWTVEWLKFDNSYFKDIKERRDEDLLVLPTDAVLFEDPGFKAHAEKYAADQDAFFHDYALAHAKLSELGSKFDPPEGIFIDKEEEKSAVKAEKFEAAKYSSGKKELSEAMKAKIKAEYLAVGGSPDQPLSSNYFLNIILAIAFLALEREQSSEPSAATNLFETPF